MPTRYMVKNQMMKVEDIINTFEKKSLKKDGELEKNKDVLRNIDFKAELRKKVRNIF